jgi:hypothetical protein
VFGYVIVSLILVTINREDYVNSWFEELEKNNLKPTILRHIKYSLIILALTPIGFAFTIIKRGIHK